MTNHMLQIQLRDSEGAVIRALGLMERRGFRVRACSVSLPDGDRQDMEVTVASERPGDLLKRQLERLHDVVRVDLKAGNVRQNGKAGIRPVTGR